MGRENLCKDCDLKAWTNHVPIHERERERERPSFVCSFVS